MSTYDVMENYFNELFGTAEQVVDSATDITKNSVTISRESYNHIAGLVTKIRTELAKLS